MSCYVLYLYPQWSLFLSLSNFPIKGCWLLARSLQTQRAWTALWWRGSPPGKPPLLSKSTWWNGGSSIRGLARGPLWTGYGLPPTTCLLWFQVLDCSPAFRRVTKFTFVWGNGRWEPQTLPFNYEWLHEDADSDDLGPSGQHPRIHHCPYGRPTNWLPKHSSIYGKSTCLTPCPISE